MGEVVPQHLITASRIEGQSKGRSVVEISLILTFGAHAYLQVNH
jgi:hypothetical protein